MKDNDVCKQTILVQFEPKDFEGILENKAGIPSAHDPGKRYFPKFNGITWICDGPQGPCKHFKIYGTECRHIKDMRCISFEELYKRICERVQYNRDIRDMDCPDIEEIVCYVTHYRSEDLNKLATLMLNIGILRGEVSTDDLHNATNEEYAGDKIMGSVVKSLKQDGLIKLVRYKKTERRCAHSRPIGIYEVTKEGGEEAVFSQSGN